MGPKFPFCFPRLEHRRCPFEVLPPVLGVGCPDPPRVSGVDKEEVLNSSVVFPQWVGFLLYRVAPTWFPGSPGWAQIWEESEGIRTTFSVFGVRGKRQRIELSIFYRGPSLSYFKSVQPHFKEETRTFEVEEPQSTGVRGDILYVFARKKL